MRNQFAMLVLSLGVVPATLAGCGAEMPTATETVRLAIIADAGHGGKLFSTHMTQEVTTVPAWAGDPDGTGTALITVNRGQGQVCWELSVSDISLPATAAHIHEAGVGIRGAIVVSLSAPNATGTVAGCTSGLDRGLLKEISQSPASFYVNVHTTDFPAGAIRGQLGR